MSSTSRALITGVFLAGVVIAACSDSSPAAPVTPSPDRVAGSYVLHTAAGSEPPAVVHRAPEVGADDLLEIYVLSDSLELTDGGRYVQRARLEARMGGVVVGRSQWADHGTYVHRSGAVHFESDYIQNVSFDGVIAADGSVHVMQDLPREGTMAEYHFRRSS